MELKFTDDELLIITQVLSQTKFQPSQAEACLKVSAILRKIQNFITERNSSKTKEEH